MLSDFRTKLVPMESFVQNLMTRDEMTRNIFLTDAASCKRNSAVATPTAATPGPTCNELSSCLDECVAYDAKHCPYFTFGVYSQPFCEVASTFSFAASKANLVESVATG